MPKRLQHGPKPAFDWHFLLPQYWLWWVAIGMLWTLTFLNWSRQYRLAQHIGRLGYRWAHKRRHETLVNLALCFPDKSADEHDTMAREVFINAAIGLFESLDAWYRPERFWGKVTISGLHHIVNAQQADQSILLLGAHYSLLDLGGLICNWFFQASIVYRPQNNALFEWLIYRARLSIYRQQISYHDMRSLVRALKSKHIVWYTPDQDFGLKQGIMAPFFGVSAATITIPRRLAAIDKSAVMGIHFYRQDDRRPHYHITITAPLTDYPGPDEHADAVRVNELLESMISIAPTQYMWFHRRFKTRPPGEKSIY